MDGRYFGALNVMNEWSNAFDMDEKQLIESFGGSRKYNAELQSFCRKGQTMDQLRLTTIKYLESHPERLHQPAPVIIEIALSEAFPVDQCSFLE